MTKYSDERSTEVDFEKVNSKYRDGGKIPYTDIHNHPRGVEHFSSDVDYDYNLPSWNDLVYFLRNDEIETTTIYQHNPRTNESEGMFVIKKTKKTPRTGISWSEWAKDFDNQKKATMKFAMENASEFNKFEVGTKDVLRDYFHLTCNPQHSKVPMSERQKTRQNLLDKIAEDLHLKIKYVPAKGFIYSSGKGFLKKEE